MLSWGRTHGSKELAAFGLMTVGAAVGAVAVAVAVADAFARSGASATSSASATASVSGSSLSIRVRSRVGLRQDALVMGAASVTKVPLPRPLPRLATSCIAASFTTL